MGWTEGTGLGKNRNGMKDHVKVKQRTDEMGLGREKEMAKEIGNVWWKDSVGGTLARLQQQKKKKKKNDNDDKKKHKKDKKRSKQESGESSAEQKKKKEKKQKKRDRTTTYTSDSNTTVIKTYTDEELFAATGGARFGMRAQRRAEGKWKRTESGTELTELEKTAKSSMEWNGRGNAKVVIDDHAKKKCKKRNANDIISEDNTDGSNAVSVSVSVSPSISEEEEDKRSKKKRRKLEKKELKKKQKQELQPSDDEEDKHGSTGTVKKSKQKKAKKSKKSKN